MKSRTKALLQFAIAIMLVFTPAMLFTSPANAADNLQGSTTTINTLDGPILSKPPLTKNPPAITVELTSESTYLWVGSSSIAITATASQDITPTPYYIMIRDSEHGGYEKICGIGSSCTFYDSEHMPVEDTPISHTYTAYIGAYPVTQNTLPNPTIAMDTLSVTWHGGAARMTASKNTLAVGEPTTLTATSSADVSEIGLTMMIFDVTANTRLAACTSGTVCTVTINQTIATTHKYKAFIGLNQSTVPTELIVSRSQDVYITWSNTGWTATLNYTYVNGQVQFTATTNKNLMSSPYYLSIYNTTTGDLVATCLTGTSCTATISYTSGHEFIAFVSGCPYLYDCPPPNIQASSRTYRLG